MAERLATPVFEPHVTLLGGITGTEAGVLDAARGLAAELPPIPIRFTGADGSDEYFRCLFLTAAADPALVDAHRRARARFARLDEPPYRPHLSLVYGELPPAERDRIGREFGRDLPRRFLARALAAVRTQGPPSAWRPLDRLPLGRVT
jgi:2'-5' RNA ligase